ncbi:hypothetical protein ACO2Q3_12870 [Caulobacter sp. KR2-114]|uniref:hypothetical protein n=1 Tax=Caulobacter sp. KR2-114 TaxID=3400912 RepID=UPI003C07BA16
MTQGEVWSRLGIAPTTDRTAIRRAYAARLKQVNPEDDAAGFMALRTAYDTALARAAAPAFALVPEPFGETDAPVPDEPADDTPATDGATADQGPADPPAPPAPPTGGRVIHRPPAAPESPSARAAHERLMAELERQVRTADVSPAVLERALEALLASPALEQLAVQIRTETWLAGLIAANLPAADPLVGRATKVFGWREGDDAVADRAAVDVVAARQADLEHLARLKTTDPRHRHDLALLTHPPGAGDAWRLLLRPGLAKRLTLLVHDLRSNHPGLALNFPPGALDAWAEWLDRPRIAATGLWTVAIGAPVLAFFIVVWRGASGPAALPKLAATWPVVTLCGVAVLALRWLAFDWPRWLWLKRWSATAGPWAAHGWAALAAAVFAAGFLLPAAPWTIGAVGAGAAVVVVWSWATGRRFTPSSALYPQWLRWPARNFGLALLLGLTLAWRDTRDGPQIALAVAGPAVATVFAEADLARFWTVTLGVAARRAALAVLALAAMGVTVEAAREVDAQPSSGLLAALALLAFAQRFPAAAAPPTRRQANLSGYPVTGLFGLAIGWVVLGALGKAAASLVALALPVGALIGLLAAFNREPPLRQWPFRRRAGPG